MSGRRIAGFVLVVALLAPALPATADPQDRLEDVRRDAGRIQDRLERVEARGDRLGSRVAALDARRAAVEARVADLDAAVARLDAKIEIVEDRLVEAQALLLELRARVESVQERLAAREQLFQERVVHAYKEGPAAVVDTLLSSGDLSDVLDRVAYYESAMDADAALIEEIQELEHELVTERDALARKKAAIARNKAELQEHRAAVARVRDRRADALAAREAAIADKEALLATVRARGSKLRSVHSELERESDRIEALLSAGISGVVAGGAGGELAWPAAGPVTSGFGVRHHPIFGDLRMHTGIDIGAPYGAPVWAADAGTVSYVGAMSGYGNVVIIEHGGALATTYNHLSATSVSSGQAVARGQVVGSVGCTGYCTGPHLHFEVRVAGTPVDPMPYLR